MSAVLGVEGGGSHTHAVVADFSGSILGVAGSRDASNWEDVGIEAAGSALKSCVRAAITDSGALPQDIEASVFSLAGVDFPLDQLRLGGVPEALGLPQPVSIVNDAFASLRAGTDEPFGVVVAAGTGAIVAGRNPDGEVFRTLGLGPMFGDWGSASEVSEAGVSAVAGAYLGRGPSTELTELMREAAGVASLVEFLEAAGRGRVDSTTFAPVVVQAAAGGDEVARAILRRAGETLGATVVFVVTKLGMEAIAFDLVLAGGLFRSGMPELIDGVSATVREAASQARPVLLRSPPVIGAVLLAMEMAGHASTPELQARMTEATWKGLGLPPL